MTDKQIIVDNVDVSGCKNFSCGRCEEENKIPRTINHFTADCRMYPNCYYKQLKRKEQENKDLREDIKDIANLLDLDTGEEYNFGNIELEIKQLKAKEQECEELDKELHKNFEEKDKLHLIIDRLLEASGYDTNTASAEDFEDVYENIRYEKQQLDQLKATNEDLLNIQYKLADNNKRLRQALTEIKEFVENEMTSNCDTNIILQKISEVIPDEKS